MPFFLPDLDVHVKPVYDFFGTQCRMREHAKVNILALGQMRPRRWVLVCFMDGWSSLELYIEQGAVFLDYEQRTLCEGKAWPVQTGCLIDFSSTVPVQAWLEWIVRTLTLTRSECEVKLCGVPQMRKFIQLVSLSS